MEPVLPEIVSGALNYASEEMGIALRNSSFSSNIKERLDHSCAIFTAECHLAAQAEHIPVHLGSLPFGISRTLSWLKKAGRMSDLNEGKMVLVSNPHLSGTHLNDLTLIRPVYGRGGELVAFVANKAHHSDVGGKTPGSISSSARHLLEEGIIIDPTVIVKHNRLVEKEAKRLSSLTRVPQIFLGDLAAQAAANLTGERRVLEAVATYGRDNFRAACNEMIRRTEFMLRREIQSRLSGSSTARDYLESRTGKLLKLEVFIKVNKEDGSITFDYSETGKQVNEPLNAVLGVTLSGIYYVTKCIVGQNVPMNEGFFRPLISIVPPGSILNPTEGLPVSAGNVETSQRNADLLFLAFSKIHGATVPAASQGTMNNVMFGSSSWAFYETVGGGMGARADKDGVDGIQVHMTNTLNTPVEDLERSYPLLVTRYCIRKDSCGHGKFRGGCGLVRSWKVIENRTSFTLVSERRRIAPWGLNGGGCAQTGATFLRRGRRMRKLGSKESILLNRGDELTLETPGGGGYGRAEERLVDAVKHDIEEDYVSKTYARIHFSRQANLLVNKGGV